LLDQIKAVEAERDTLLAAERGRRAKRRRRMLLDNQGRRGPSSPPFSGRKGSSGTSTIDDRFAAYAGLAPTPWQSGSVDREQGVSKAGNPRLRTTLIQLDVALATQSASLGVDPMVSTKRVQAQMGGACAKTTIVAVARKLLVALWKYVTAGRRHRRPP